MDKPFSPSCERNRDVILDVLQNYITKDDKRVLEIGAGTGQHAIYFAPHFAHVKWYPTDLAKNLGGMNLWLKDAGISNIQKAQALDVSKDDFPKLKFDVVFTANTLHIMHWKETKSFIKLLGLRLRENSRAIFYGPFKYNGEFTSESNEIFDRTLKTNDPQSGIRSVEDINNAMIKNGFKLLQDISMPANNQILIYSRLEFVKEKVITTVSSRQKLPSSVDE